MQDIHSIGSGGGGGRLFGGAADRRLRPNLGQIPPALKCPRCESANTKFCYYNNYNLSQPRHFCKNCRRYWTKGGVLRNVPVGGGCRKTKRSKPKPDTSIKELNPANSPKSSSESSSLTASNTTAVKSTAAAEVLSGSSSNSASTLMNFSESRFFSIPQSTTTTNPSFDPPLVDQSSENGMFIGSFTSLMNSNSNQPPLGFNNVDISSFQLHQQSPKQQQKMIENEVRMHDLGGGYLNEFSELQNRTNDGGLATVDWQSGGGDEGLFDLAGTVDQSYWNQTQWPDTDHQLNYLP